MSEDMPFQDALPALLATQLLAAEVYTHFLRLSSDREENLWRKMLDDELDHVDHLRRVLRIEIAVSSPFPHINVPRVRETCEAAKQNGSSYFLLRLEGALRLECAELDFGLEGLTAKRLEKSYNLPNYSGDIAEHLDFLMAETERYAESPNIGRQRQRLIELLETCLKDKTYDVSNNTTTVFPKTV